MKSEVSARSGRAARSRATNVDVVCARVPAVHRGEDAIGSRLHRQMQLRHEFRQIAMRRDQIVVHVARVTGGVAQPIDAVDLR